MNQKTISTRVVKILSIVPEIREILQSADGLEEKRRKIRHFLSDRLFALFDDDPTIPPLEWILARNAVNAFRSILANRSERLAGFSLLGYLDEILHAPSLRGRPAPDAGFYAELTHLLEGIAGETGIYSDKVPAFSRHSGRQAARLRSSDLSRMARQSNRFIRRYESGLTDAAIQRRSENKARILSYFGASEADWDRWRWHTSHIIRDAETLGRLVTLTDEEREAVSLARADRIPFGITPYYVSLMDETPGGGRDTAVRAQVIPPLSYVRKMTEIRNRRDCSMDFMLEHDTSPIEGITRRYPNIVILKPILTCPQICVYCQRNWEIDDVCAPDAAISRKALDRAIGWIAETPEINEVLVTGGDPLLMTDDRIEGILARLSEIPHVERIRIGTRTLVTLPQRITEDLVRAIIPFHIPGKREILVVTHVEHIYELTPAALEAVQKFRRHGIDIYNQLVYTFYNSRKFEAAALRHQLRLMGVTPYYTFNTKGKEETDDYRVPIARLLQEQHEEARLMPGSVRTDEIVFNVPQLGKNYLRASQHHDIIAVLPDGRRVYEFHPWEKKLSLVDTYVYTDVSIHQYLKRLKAAGENPADYRTLWYYY